MEKYLASAIKSQFEKLDHDLDYQKTLKKSKEKHHLYKPYTDDKGIHCQGDDFHYVVEWEIHEEI
jgi:hypothetical protein